MTSSWSSIRVAWHANSRKPDGEADFLIGHPDLGFLVVEVKGGAIDFDASTARWTSRDRHGETFPIKDPFTQALDAKHELLRELQDGCPSGRVVAASRWDTSWSSRTWSSPTPASRVAASARSSSARTTCRHSATRSRIACATGRRPILASRPARSASTPPSSGLVGLGRIGSRCEMRSSRTSSGSSSSPNSRWTSSPPSADIGGWRSAGARGPGRACSRSPRPRNSPERANESS